MCTSQTKIYRKKSASRQDKRHQHLACTKLPMSHTAKWILNKPKKKKTSENWNQLLILDLNFFADENAGVFVWRHARLADWPICSLGCYVGWIKKNETQTPKQMLFTWSLKINVKKANAHRPRTKQFLFLCVCVIWHFFFCRHRRRPSYGSAPLFFYSSICSLELWIKKKR